MTKANYAKDAYILENYDYLASLDAFADGDIQVQDPSSMLVAQAAGISAGDFVLDLWVYRIFEHKLRMLPDIIKRMKAVQILSFVMSPVQDMV